FEAEHAQVVSPNISMGRGTMKARPRGVRLVAGIFCALLVLGIGLVAFSCFSRRSFRSDGTMSDRPWSYPRYRVECSEISLNSPGQWTWNMEGLPAVPLTLKLEMVNKGDYEALGKCRTYAECVLTEQNGKEIGAVRGPLLSWTLAWVPANDTVDF